MLTKTQSFFLSVLKDHIHKNSTVPDTDINWEDLCAMALTHQLSGIVYYQCKSYIKEHMNEKACADLASSFFQSVYSSKQRENAYLEIKTAFKAAGIVFFTVKGETVAEYYPVPELRVMGDIDIVLSTDDRVKAHEIIQNLGYRNTVYEDAEWEYVKNGIEIELHDKLEYEQLTEHNLYFNDFWKYVKTENGESYLDPNFHFLYLLLHLRKHLISFGVGFRQFMDIAVMAEVNKEILDWPWIIQELQKTHLLAFVQQCAEFCKLWFDIDIPIEREAIDQAFYFEATRSVFANGVFGFHNKDNADVSVNQIAKSTALSETTVSRTMVRKTVQNIFPSYHTMSSAEHYAFLRGRPYLLPAAWVYRLWRGISLKKMNHVSKMVSDVNTSMAKTQDIENRANYLKQWKI